jgi:hypothetical protein
MTRALVLVLLLVLWSSPARADERQGAVILARNAEALPAAKALARTAYRDRQVRPAIDESTARILIGEPQGEGASAKAVELAEVARTALAQSDGTIATRLLSSLGRDLEVELVVVVELWDTGPQARVLAVSEGRFLPLVLSPKVSLPPPPPEAPPGPPAAPLFDWSGATRVLRGLAHPPAPSHLGPSVAPAEAHARPAPPAPSPPDDKGKFGRNLLTSPWFWGGLAAVVTVGVTVLVLSQTALNEPDTVILDGRIGH